MGVVGVPIKDISGLIGYRNNCYGIGVMNGVHGLSTRKVVQALVLVTRSRRGRMMVVACVEVSVNVT